MVELKDEVLENATGGAGEKTPEEKFKEKCGKCWKMGTKECQQVLAAAKDSGWTIKCTL